jgi:hypothetical protein
MRPRPRRAPLIGAPSCAIWGCLSGVGHPGFVAFAATAPTITTTVPTRSAVTSRQFGGSTSGGRGGQLHVVRDIAI